MKKTLLTSLLVLSCLLMLSCSKGNDKKKPAETPVSVETVTSDSISEYTIVYPDCMGTYAERFTPERYSALRLKAMIEEKFAISLTTQSDRNEATAKEILIGNARGKDIAATEGFSIVKSEGTISVNAGGIFPYSCAFDALVSELGKDGTIPEAIDISEDKVALYDTEKDFVYIDLTEKEFTVPEYAVKSLTINGNDISEYKIIYHVWGSPTEPHFGLNEEYAAQQLQRYIKLATGVELPVETDESEPTQYEIVVGITDREGDVIDKIDRSGYGEEDTLIKNEGERLIISGAQRRGTIYAAYTFLEKYLGVRFFASDCEVIYKADSIDISDIFYEHVSDMEFRDSNQRTMQNGEIASKRKLNSNFRRIMNYKQGGTFSFACEFPHTMGTVLKLDNAPGHAQPCFTDEATYEKALSGVMTLLERNPDCKLVSVTQNDDYNYCDCTECTSIINEEGAISAPLIRFINRLADDVKDDYPNARILTFAYWFSEDPPKTVPRDNVIIMYCPIDSCCACALNDPDCQTNHKYAEDLEGWCELTDNVYIWYYVAEYTQNDTIPFMDFESIYDNYQYFRSLGVKGMFNQGWMDNEGNEFDVMRAYLLSLLMWYTDMTKDEYRTAMYEFIDAYYGEGSEVIKEYFYAMETASENKHFGQYATVNGILDTAILTELSSEADMWWEELNAYEYPRNEVKQHITNLYLGYKKIKENLG